MLDEFEDLLESGARVAKEQRRWLIGIPIVFGMGTLFMLLFTGWTILQQAVFLGRGANARSADDAHNPDRKSVV